MGVVERLAQAGAVAVRAAIMAAVAAVAHIITAAAIFILLLPEAVEKQRSA